MDISKIIFIKNIFITSNKFYLTFKLVIYHLFALFYCTTINTTKDFNFKNY